MEMKWDQQGAELQEHNLISWNFYSYSSFLMQRNYQDSFPVFGTWGGLFCSKSRVWDLFSGSSGTLCFSRPPWTESPQQEKHEPVKTRKQQEIKVWRKRCYVARFLSLYSDRKRSRFVLEYDRYFKKGFYFLPISSKNRNLQLLSF